MVALCVVPTSALWSVVDKVIHHYIPAGDSYVYSVHHCHDITRTATFKLHNSYRVLPHSELPHDHKYLRYRRLVWEQRCLLIIFTIARHIPHNL